MLFPQAILRGIADGTVTLAFRRWRRSPPREGSTLRTSAGVVALERVTVIEDGDITADDVKRCGMSPEQLRASLSGVGTLMRIELRLLGDDPRIALRAVKPDATDLADISNRLRSLDRSEPWTTRYLRLIADRPGVVARTLAPRVGAELAPFKRRVRQLKELGLTESLDVGYRLSPRGQDVLDAIEPQT